MWRNDGATLAATLLSHLVDVSKALAHPARLRILAMLRDGDLCVCQLTAILGLASSTVSGHLADLRRTGLLTEEKRGRWVHYQLAGDEPLAHLLADILGAIKDDPQISDDRQLVLALRRVPNEVLCRAGLDLEAVGVRPVTPHGVRGH